MNHFAVKLDEDAESFEIVVVYEIASGDHWAELHTYPDPRGARMKANAIAVLLNMASLTPQELGEYATAAVDAEPSMLGG
jgi:hypothetical protein